MKKNRLSGMVYDEVSFVDKGACEDEDGNGAHVLLVKRDPDSHLAGRKAPSAASRYGSADAAERRTASRPAAKRPAARKATARKKPVKSGPAGPWGLAGRKHRPAPSSGKKGGGGGSKRAANWKEERHKRAAAGSPAGGEFATTSSDSKKKYGKGGTTAATLRAKGTKAKTKPKTPRDQEAEDYREWRRQKAEASRKSRPDYAEFLAWQTNRKNAEAANKKPPAKKVVAPAAKNYKIKRGETLWGLAERFYGSGTLWRRIAQANGISDPRKIPAGKMLKIPPKKTPAKKSVKKLSMQDFRSYIVGM